MPQLLHPSLPLPPPSIHNQPWLAARWAWATWIMSTAPYLEGVDSIAPFFRGTPFLSARQTGEHESGQRLSEACVWSPVSLRPPRANIMRAHRFVITPHLTDRAVLIVVLSSWAGWAPCKNAGGKLFALCLLGIHKGMASQFFRRMCGAFCRVLCRRTSRSRGENSLWDVDPDKPVQTMGVLLRVVCWLWGESLVVLDMQRYWKWAGANRRRNVWNSQRCEYRLTFIVDDGLAGFSLRCSYNKLGSEKFHTCAVR